MSLGNFIASVNTETEQKISDQCRYLMSFWIKSPVPTTNLGKQHEIFSIYFDYCFKNESLPQNPLVDVSKAVYGTFSDIDVLENLLEDRLLDIVDQRVTLQELRIEFLKTVYALNFLEEEQRNIDISVIQEFVQQMVTNRIWNDVQVKQYMPKLYQYTSDAVAGVDQQFESIGKDGKPPVILTFADHDDMVLTEEQFENLKFCYREQYDGMEYREKLRTLFNKIEAESRKQGLPKHLRKYCDAIDLHSLKSLMKDYFGNYFRPIGWQAEFLMTHKRFNVVVASRRAGKTFMSAYMAGRGLYIPTHITIFVVPTKTNHLRTPWRYIMQMIDADYKSGAISRNKEESTIRHKKNKSEIIFISGEKNDNVRGDSANLLVVDEAAYLKEDVFDAAMPLVRSVKGMTYVISTVHLRTPKNRFYYILIDHELQTYDKNSIRSGRRVTLYENPFIDEDEKEDIIQDGRRNQKKFGSEYMCDFQEGDVFDLKKFRVMDYQHIKHVVGNLWQGEFHMSAFMMKKYEKYFLIHDSGKLKDKPGLVLAGYDRENNIMQTLCAGYLEGLDYLEQVQVLVEMRKIFPNTEIIIEYNNNGVVIDELLRTEHRIYQRPVHVLGGMLENTDERVRKIGKDRLMADLKTSITLNVLKAYSFMGDLRKEMESYDPENSKKRQDGHHFDILSCMRILGWVCRNMGLFGMEQKKIHADQEIIDARMRAIGLATKGHSAQRYSKKVKY